MGDRVSYLNFTRPTYARNGSKDNDHTRSVRNRSRPLVHRPLLVLALNAVLICICISIILLWQFSRSSDGYHLNGANPYLLKYGPTAVFVLLIGVWRQVDFHTKSAMPWNELAEGLSKGSRSLLLDYVSIFQAVAFWKSFRNRHWSVVLSILGFIALKTSTMISTGLLTIGSSVINLHSNGNTETALSSNAFTDNTSLIPSDQSIVYTTYGILDQHLQKPLGLGDGLAYSTFSLPSGLSSYANITVQLDAFMPLLQCKEANISAKLPSLNNTDSFPETLLQLSSSECQLRLQDVAIFTLNPGLFKCPERQLSGVVRSIDCGSSAFGVEGGAYKLIAMADMRYSQKLNDTQVNEKLSAPVQASTWATEIVNLVGVICRLSYKIQPIIAQAQASNVAESFSYTISDDNESFQLPNFSDEYLDQFLDSSLGASDEILGSRTLNRYALEYPDPMLKLMSLTMGGSYEDLLNVSQMAVAADNVTSKLAAQLAHQYLRNNSSSSLPMRVDVFDTRLKVATIPAWIIVGLLLLVAGTNTLLAILRSRKCSLMPVEDLDSIASMLSNNTALVPDLINSQTYTEKELLKVFANMDVHYSKVHSGQDQILLDQSISLRKIDSRPQPWWNPVTVSKPALIFTFCSAAAAIATLELLQHLTDTKQGFVRLPPNAAESDIIYIRFFPAIIVLLLASLFNCLDFNVILLTPFYKMRSGVSLSEVKARSLLSRTAVYSLWVSLRTLSWAAIASSLAAFVASTMTIVVSGLYSIEELPIVQSAQLVPLDNFSTLWTNSATNDNGAALISTLTENLKFPDPRGTFGEIAFPNLRFAQSELNQILGTFSETSTTIDSRRNTSFSANVPSMRGHLDCTTLSSSDFSASVSQSKILNSISVNASYELPPDCLFGGANGTDSVLNFIETFSLSNNVNSTYIGKLLDLHVGPYDEIEGSSQGEQDPSAMNDNPFGCPSLAFIYGFIDLNNVTDGSSGSEGITVDICYQRLQTLNVEFEFTDSSFTVNESKPFQVGESAVQYLATGKDVTFSVRDINASTAYQFRLQGHFEQSFAVFNTTNDNPFSAMDTASQVVDSFFQGMLFGRTPIPVTALKIGNEDQKNLVQKAILEFYRRYMAQAISLNMRAATHQSDAAAAQAKEDSITATIYAATVVRRVVQDKVSKLILQGMLCFMLVCGIIAICNIRMNKLLPACANPCTIWGRMSLWAGSRICEADSPKRKQTFTYDYPKLGKESQESEPVMHMLKLGWWSMFDGRKRYGIDFVR